MGNQPSKRNLPGRGGRSRYPRKMIDNTKKSVSGKKYEKATKIAMGAGLKEAGKGFLAAAVIAGAVAYENYKTKGSTGDIQKVINDAVTKVISEKKFEVTRQGRNVLKSSLNTTFASLE